MLINILGPYLSIIILLLLFLVTSVEGGILSNPEKCRKPHWISILRFPKQYSQDLFKVCNQCNHVSPIFISLIFKW